MAFGTLSAGESQILIAIFLAELAFGFGLWRWLVAHGKIGAEHLEPSKKRRLYLLILVFLLAHIIAVSLGGFFSHFDRPWFAVAGAMEKGWVLSPAHYYIFFTCYPAYLIFGGAIYILVNNWLPDLWPSIKWPLIIVIGIPFIFIPALDGNLLDQNITIPESIYVTFYWVANLVWVALGIIPITYYAFRNFISDLSI